MHRADGERDAAIARGLLGGIAEAVGEAVVDDADPLGRDPEVALDLALEVVRVGDQAVGAARSRAAPAGRGPRSCWLP